MIDPNDLQALLDLTAGDDVDEPPKEAESKDGEAPERVIEFRGDWKRRGSKGAYYYRLLNLDFTKPELDRLNAIDDDSFSLAVALPARKAKTLYGSDGRFRLPDYARNQLARGFKPIVVYDGPYNEKQELNSPLGVAENKSAHEYWPTFVRDVFASLYGMNTTDIGQNEPAFACEYLDIIENSEHLRKIRRATRLDPDLAIKTAGDIINNIPSPAPETAKDRDERDKGEEQKNPDRSLKAERRHQKVTKGIEKLLEQAGEAAQGIVDRQEQPEDKPAYGQGNTRFAGHSYLESKFGHVEHIDIENISEIAGRAMSTAYNSRAKNACAPGGIADVECGRDVPRWLPAELALMSDPDTEMLALARFAERSALQFKMEGDDDMGRGEIVLFIDLSSSMHCDDISFHGRAMTRNVWAAGVAMALWQVATWQNRTCRLIGYTVGVCFDETVQSEKQATEILSRKYHGGTSLGEAITYVRNAGYTKSADFVVVSDGEDWDWEGAAKQAKSENDVRIHAVAISGEWRNIEELDSYTHVTGDQLDLTEQYAAL